MQTSNLYLLLFSFRDTLYTSYYSNMFAVCCGMYIVICCKCIQFLYLNSNLMYVKLPLNVAIYFQTILQVIVGFYLFLSIGYL